MLEHIQAAIAAHDLRNCAVKSRKGKGVEIAALIGNRIERAYIWRGAIASASQVIRQLAEQQRLARRA